MMYWIIGIGAVVGVGVGLSILTAWSLEDRDGRRGRDR